MTTVSFSVIIKKITIFFLGIFVAFIILEISVRFYLNKTQVNADKQCRSKDFLFHHLLIPNTSCRSKTQEWDIDFNVNSLGLRDYEYSFEKREGTYRILMLGDSFTEGYGVKLEKTFSKIFEKKLNNSAEKISQVINAGVTGYSPTIEYLYLKFYV